MPSRASRTRTRFHTAVLLLCLVGAALAAVLVSCPRVKPSGAPPPPPASPAAGPAETAVPAEPGPDAGGTPPPLSSTEPVRPAVRGRLAIIIDDAGYDLADLQPFLDLPMPLAVAVLPNLPHSTEAARRVRAAGKELLLHLPMEPEGGEDPGPGALLTTHPAVEIERLLDAALASVPGAVGVNNHMGSKATADPAFMDVLLDALGRRALFFVDSRTTSLTVAAAEAERLGVPYLARKVFLDVVDGGIERSLAAAVDAALQGGSVVAIGHVQSDDLAGIIHRTMDGMEKSGVQSSTLSALIADPGGRAAE